jgi:LPS-assembly lipoprotein
MIQWGKLLLIVVLGVASGCGYHLKGSLEISDELKNVYMSGDTPSLHSAMGNMMKASKGKLATASGDANIVIKISKEDMRTRVLSIGTTGKSTESELNYYVRFQFFDNQDRPLQDEQTIEITREFFNNQTAVLAKSSEELLLRDEMYQQATRILMSRAKIAIDNQKTDNSKQP